MKRILTIIVTYNGMKWIDRCLGSLSMSHEPSDIFIVDNGSDDGTPEYVSEKILAGKAVIAIAEDGRFAGFSYIETWGGKEYVANSGLIVAHAFRGLGLAMRIKTRIFELSREKYPNAKIFSITTGAAVMKMNYELGFRPVTFAALTDDPEFWKGCQGCRNYQILESNDYRMCLCTGLLYDPKEHIEVLNPADPKIANLKDGEQKIRN